MVESTSETAPSLGRDALSGRLERALTALEDRDGPSIQWRRAWLLTAAGRYGDALEACELAKQGAPIVQAAELMAEAMLYRQVSLHARAEVADDLALETLRASRVRSPSVRAAIRVGQVADAVGLGADDAVLARRVKVAAGAVTTAGSWRQKVRLTWVRGEVAMVRGAYRDADRAFGTGARIAHDQGARRHEAKSLIFLAAASAAREQQSEAVRLARRGLQLAARCGAAPLVWPAELILAEVDTDTAEEHLDRARRVAGGLIDSLPEPLQAEARARPPASWLLTLDPHGAGHVTDDPSPLDIPTDA